MFYLDIARKRKAVLQLEASDIFAFSILGYFDEIQQIKHLNRPNSKKNQRINQLLEYDSPMRQSQKYKRSTKWKETVLIC